ncbi:Uncharacterized protein, containing periplasmic binding domain [Pseudoalteromonas luteoviolacea B = ATCC 29581]|nr:Uncharacterized protein, containing periplasmic binding domain [Pseudoalteromonas luteoviolacea B = ATCC 29581]
MLRLVVFFFVMLSNSVFASQKTFLFNKPADTPQSRYVVEIVTLAYRNLGIDVQIVEFNHKSALVAANEGQLDGQLARIPDVETMYSHLVKVPVPLFNFNLQKIAKCALCTLGDIDKLVITEGYPIIEQFLEKMPFQGDLFKVKNFKTQLNLLQQEKVDGALAIDFHIPESYRVSMQESWHFENVEEVETFHFIHEKHKELVDELAKQFSSFSHNGTMQALKQKYGI